jgi:1-acyl-sn-glycerol-3-phosphate acyltransferase
MFVIIALGLPNSRYFLSGFLRKFLPLWLIGWLIGIFWTALQKYPERRTKIFQNAERVLRRTGESVFLTPEGQVTWRFNKGAFHLATALRAPILPIYILIPNDVDPGPWFGGDGLTARPGEVHVHYKPPIETSQWRLADLDANRNRVREMYLAWKQELLATHSGALPAEAAAS